MPNSQQDITSKGHTRRGFLARLGVGMAALAAVSLPFVPFRGTGADSTASPFPGKGSIFHPAQDPRSDPRRNRNA